MKERMVQVPVYLSPSLLKKLDKEDNRSKVMREALKKYYKEGNNE
ncbi:MAG: hypothetical protein ACQEQD_04480 [Bacillota bacterium]